MKYYDVSSGKLEECCIDHGQLIFGRIPRFVQLNWKKNFIPKKTSIAPGISFGWKSGIDIGPNLWISFNLFKFRIWITVRIGFTSKKLEEELLKEIERICKLQDLDGKKKSFRINIK